METAGGRRILFIGTAKGQAGDDDDALRPYGRPLAALRRTLAIIDAGSACIAPSPSALRTEGVLTFGAAWRGHGH